MDSDNCNVSTDTFLSDLESRFGGKITYRCFASYYADSKGNIKDHGVFFFVINNVFHFQDFETHKSIFGVPLKNKEKYVKFESSFEVKDVLSIRTVSRKKAEKFCRLFIGYDRLKTASLLTRFFCETVQEFTLKDGTYLYFRFMDKKVEKMIYADKILQ